MVKPDIKFSDFIKILKTDSKADFVGKVSGEFLKIFPATENDHRIVTSYLDSKKVDHYVILTKHDRPIKVVIRGLPIDCPVEEISEALQDQGFKVRRVAQMHRIKTRIPMPLYQAQINNVPGVEQVYDIVKLLGFYVKVTAYQSNRSVVQCHNCQHFHHSSDNCKFKPRSVKCAGPHKSAECSAKRLDIVKCCNCLQTGHTANYRGCSKFPVNNTIKNKNAGAKVGSDTLSAPKQSETNVQNSHVSNGRTFAAAVKNVIFDNSENVVNKPSTKPRKNENVQSHVDIAKNCNPSAEGGFSAIMEFLSY